jgi:hypothetical protein
MKKYYFLTVLLLLVVYSVSAQDYAAGKGAFIVNGTASFSSSGGKLYESLDNKRITSLQLTPSIDYFLLRNCFVGSTLIYSHDKIGSRKENTYGIGPELGFVFAKPGSKILPVISLGYLFTSQSTGYINSPYDDYDPGYGGYGNGYDMNESMHSDEIFAAFGVIIPVMKHIGLTIGGIYRSQNFKQSGFKTSGNIFALNVGINGLLYKEKSLERKSK